MKKSLILAAALCGSYVSAAHLDKMLLDYSNGEAIINQTYVNSSVKETQITREAALEILEHISADKDNTDCQIVSFKRIDQSSAEIITRTNGTVELGRLLNSENWDVETSGGNGLTVQAPFQTLDSMLVDQVGHQFQMIRIRTLAVADAKGKAGAGDEYTDLRVYYADTTLGPKILKIESEKFASKVWYFGKAKFHLLNEVSGACEPHRAAAPTAHTHQ